GVRGRRRQHPPRGPRPQVRVPGSGRLRRLLLSGVPGVRPAHDQGPGRHLRLGYRLGGAAGRDGWGPHAGGGEGMSEATASPTRSEPSPIRFWVPGDLNAFFGLGTNVMLNVI